MLDDSLRAPISSIKNDRFDILKYHEEKEIIRLNRKQYLEQKERVDAINTIKSLIDEWGIKPDEILRFERSDEYLYIRDEEPYVPDYSEEALNYSIKVHDTLGLDYKCKECIVRAACCRFSNAENLEVNNVCDGVTQLLSATIIAEIEDYYI